MSIFKCKMCGGTLEIQPNATVAECEYCGTTQTLPKLDDGRKANLFDRANHFRRNNEFDKAAGIYEQILNEDGSDAETYWSLVLCRYGIEYVEDPATHKRVPTVNRAQFTSIFDDDNYKSALNYADGYQRSIYEDEAKAINEIQKGILAISQKEEPFDVFICYKETDNSGRRTPDSVLATDLYHQLTQEGFKVFFSRITLEDKLGTAYEPYIFAALNSAKVMVVLGTKPEYFNAVWVKNEWSRYLALIKSGAKKLLIPAYRDMDPYDLPEEFSHLQAQDMSKLGFMQDLIRGIKKILSEDAPKPAAKETVVVNAGNANTDALLERAFMFLEDGDWKSADEYCERVLDTDPKNAQAYLGKLMAELQVRKQENLKDCRYSFENKNSYQKVLRFADQSLCEELKGYIRHIEERNEHNRLENLYARAADRKAQANSEDAYKQAAEAFAEIPGYRDADSQKQECLELAENARKDAIYEHAMTAARSHVIEDLEDAIKQLQTISGWKDADKQIRECQQRIETLKAEEEAKCLERERLAELQKKEAAEQARRNKKIVAIAIPAVAVCIAVIVLLTTVIIPNNKYKKAIALMDTGDYENALSLFSEVRSRKDVENYFSECLTAVADRQSVAVGGSHTVRLRSDGTVAAIGNNKSGQCDVSGWTNIVSVCAGSNCTVGLKSDGTVVATGNNNSTQCDVQLWTDIVSIATSGYHTVGLKSNGMVVATGANHYDECNVSQWTDIVSVCAGARHTVGLKTDGTVVAVGDNDKIQCNVSNWTDIVAISAGSYHTVGLKKNGTVVAVGDFGDDQCDVSEWTDIVAISADNNHTVGLKSDGTLVATGNNEQGQCDVSGWSDIVSVFAGGNHTAGLKTDGTMVITGSNNLGECNITGWTDIVAISAGSFHTVGLKADGTAVAVGDNDDGECNVCGWTDIVSISAGSDHTVGIKSDGTVVAVGQNDKGQCDVSDWTDIVSVIAGYRCTVGLKSDGTVVTAGDTYNVSGWNHITDVFADGAIVGITEDGGVVGAYTSWASPHFDNILYWKDVVSVDWGNDLVVGLKTDGTVVEAFDSDSYHFDDWKPDFSSWTDIVAISVNDGSDEFVVGLKSDGTVLTSSRSEPDACNVSGWNNIVDIIACNDRTIGLKANGKVVAVGDNNDGQCNVSSWTDIVAIAASRYHTVGLKADGTVVAVGDNSNGECNVSNWTNIKLPD